MLITDSFVFAHIPKTGGSFLQALLGEYFVVRESHVGAASHRSIERLPAEHRDKPVFALLRNPFAWYVSWFHFCRAMQDNAEFRLNYRPGPDEFRSTIAGVLRPRHSDPGIEQFMREQDIGLLEMHRFHILDLECATHHVCWGRLEHLRADFLDFLDQHDLDVPPRLAAALSGAPTNASGHGPWRSYYDAGLRELVARKERHIIRLGSYRFE